MENPNMTNLDRLNTMLMTVPGLPPARRTVYSSGLNLLWLRKNLTGKHGPDLDTLLNMSVPDLMKQGS